MFIVNVLWLIQFTDFQSNEQLLSHLIHNAQRVCKLYNVIHPSVFGRYIKYQIPNNYFKHLEEMKIEH